MKTRMLTSAALLCVGLSGCAFDPYAVSDYGGYQPEPQVVYYRPAPPTRYVPTRYVVVERPAPPVRHVVYERPAPYMAQMASAPRGHEERQVRHEERSVQHHDHGDKRDDRR